MKELIAIAVCVVIVIVLLTQPAVQQALALSLHLLTH